MASNEDGLWEWLRDVVLPLGHYSRIESPDTSPGFPDVDYIIGGHSGKLELKHSRGRTKIPFRNAEEGIHKSQKIWIRDAIRNGGVVWIIAEITPEVLIIPGAHWNINGKTLGQLRGMATACLHISETEHAARVFETILRPE